MRALLALGNFWNAYRGPETWTEWAKAAGGGGAGWTGDVVDFYRWGCGEGVSRGVEEWWEF